MNEETGFMCSHNLFWLSETLNYGFGCAAAGENLYQLGIAKL